MIGGLPVGEGNTRRRPCVLRKRADFEALLRAGTRLTSRNFVVRAHPNAFAHARLGIIAGRKAAARAVDRNRGKRLIREVFRAAGATLGTHDIAVQLRTDLRAQPNDALRAELRRLLQAAVGRSVREAGTQRERQ
ncbi:MAG: ribonuclease P protein component [Burkholderiales bacterium]